MRVLLDTHVILGLVRQTLSKEHPKIAQRLADESTISFVSVASLWETAIKARLGKLDPGMPLEDIAGYLEAVGLSILPIEVRHVTIAADPAPETRDPFDGLLLAQCQVDDLKLVTLDRALLNHRLVLKT
jgi:PIN domain nuclease of toxin-antitoxin system